MIAEEYRLLEIAARNGTKIFENATVSNCIPFIQNSQPKGELRITQIFEDKSIREVLSKSPEALKQDNKNYVWNLTEEERTGNRFANMTFVILALEWSLMQMRRMPKEHLKKRI